MGLEPHAHAIPRRGRGTNPEGGVAGVPVARWSDVAQRLRSGEVGPFWLGVNHDGHGPHVRPVFAAWSGDSFYFVSKATATKTARLRREHEATVSVDLGDVHLVVEGSVARVTDPDGLAAASGAVQEVFGWPTRVEGDELDADYGAPTSGGPPYQVYELVPVKAYAFPTQDQVQPTRWTFAAR
jgi:hypothetical protein